MMASEGDTYAFVGLPLRKEEACQYCFVVNTGWKVEKLTLRCCCRRLRATCFPSFDGVHSSSLALRPSCCFRQS
jgi:hypothetical protein